MAKIILRLPDLRELGITFSALRLREMEAAGTFPRRFTLSSDGRHVFWDRSEIDAWLEARKAAREAA